MGIVEGLDEVRMDWIERWLGLSPDGGNGSLELALALVPMAVIAMSIFAVLLGVRARMRVRRRFRLPRIFDQRMGFSRRATVTRGVALSTPMAP